MATIKAIEAGTVHRIQSGQVIVDLCSVVKELVENSLDAGATAIDVRFKNQGLDSIEVQDNGSGISPDNYEGLALKHYTSKLSTFSDLGALSTFGFRGEALSSLCALAQVSVLTCLAGDSPRGTKLDFLASGRLSGTSVVAAQKGTAVSVNNLFYNLPVRRRELERNIKREWSKVISLLNQYACIQTSVKFTVSQQPNKGKRVVLFSTKGNPTVRDNIINIFGAKTMTVLVKLDIELEFEPTTSVAARQLDNESTCVRVQGYVSRPAHGEGRQTPDRQMFFINGRPCSLPQFAKVFNEVYKSYNASQSPFILANIQLDTHLYDVNVSPDKRTILLHDQGRMLETLREALVDLFESQDYSIPASKLPSQTPKLSPPGGPSSSSATRGDRPSHVETSPSQQDTALGSDKDEINTQIRADHRSVQADYAVAPTKTSKLKPARSGNARDAQAQSLISRWVAKQSNSEVSEPASEDDDDSHDVRNDDNRTESTPSPPASSPLYQGRDAASHKSTVTRVSQDSSSLRTQKLDTTENDASGARSGTARIQDPNVLDTTKTAELPIVGISPLRKTYDTGLGLQTRSHTQKRTSPDMATITIGDKTFTGMLGSSSKRLRHDSAPPAADESSDNTGGPTRGKPASSGGLPGWSSATCTSSQPQSPASGSVLRTGTANENEERMPEYSDFAVGREPAARRIQGYASPLEEPFDPAGNDTEAENSLHNRGGPSKEEDELTNDTNNGHHAAEPPPSGRAGRHVALSRPRQRKDATLPLEQTIKTTVSSMESHAHFWTSQLSRHRSLAKSVVLSGGIEAENAEETLSLIISKSNFGNMSVIGQFNLGFILAVWRKESSKHGGDTSGGDHLFIIDQHASDEKYNFERLQSTTVVEPQRLVQPKRLELTALEEEVVIQNLPALEFNGFKVRVDESGAQPVGSRCELVSLPLSRETTFTIADLEELIALLGDDGSTGGGPTPRPSKVRKMFAMRACRGSVMIGKALAHRQMEKIVHNMGELDKPWNCPHGRPTMRHVCNIGDWDERRWSEDSGVRRGKVRWARYVRSSG